MGSPIVNHSEIRAVLIEYGVDPDEIRLFLEEKVSESRVIDEATKDSLGKNQFYKRELTYSKVDTLIQLLK